MQVKAEAILSEAEKKERNADRKLVRAKQLMTEYQIALAKEVVQVKKRCKKMNHKIVKTVSEKVDILLLHRDGIASPLEF